MSWGCGRIALIDELTQEVERLVLEVDRLTIANSVSAAMDFTNLRSIPLERLQEELAARWSAVDEADLCHCGDPECEEYD